MVENKTTTFHPDVLAAHAQFGGDLESMQKCYDHDDHVAAIEKLTADNAALGDLAEGYAKRAEAAEQSLWVKEGASQIALGQWRHRAETAEAESAILRKRVERLEGALSKVKTWAEQKCPCENEEPNPCPLCGASVENLENCKAVDRTFPKHIIAALDIRKLEDRRLDGNRPIPILRDELGRMVREAWVRWAETQPSPKTSWLAPYHDLSEADKEADRQIGEAVARWTLIADAARAAIEEPKP